MTKQLNTGTIDIQNSKNNLEYSSLSLEKGLTSEKKNCEDGEEANWRNLVTPNKSLFEADNDVSFRSGTSGRKNLMQNNLSDLNHKIQAKAYENEQKFKNSLEDFKVSKSDANDNSLLTPQNLAYGDDKENSILNHPNVLRSNQSKSSKQNRVHTEEDNDLTKSQMMAKSNNNMNSSSNMNISFLNSLGKGDNFALKINEYLKDNPNAVLSDCSDSENHKDMEALLKTVNQSNGNNGRDDTKNDLESSLNAKELSNADESLFKSVIISSSKKQKREIFRELMKEKDNPAMRARAKLLVSSYMSNDQSPNRNISGNYEDDLKLSQTKMEDIVEENEEKENDVFNDFINKNNDPLNISKTSEREEIPVRQFSDSYKGQENPDNMYQEPLGESFNREKNLSEYEQEFSPKFTPEICKEDHEENKMLQNYMHSKKTTNSRGRDAEMDNLT